MALASAQPVDGDGEIAVAESLPGSYHGLRPIMHPAHPVHAEASAFSDDQYGLWLLRNEWFSVMLALDMAEGEIQSDDGTPTMFHGTEWGAAFQIVRNRAFIIGPGTHGIRGRSMAGCWCVPTLPDALLRCNPNRFMDHEHGYSRWSCPVVFELRAARLVRVPRSTMHCVPGGEIGEVHNGLVIDRIHFNIRLMKNFMTLEQQDVRRTLLANPHQNRICHCGLCGTYTHSADPSWWEWRRTNAGHYYHPRCHKRIISPNIAAWSHFPVSPMPCMYNHALQSPRRQTALGPRGQCPLYSLSLGRVQKSEACIAVPWMHV